MVISSDPWEAAWEVVGMIAVGGIVIGGLSFLFLKFIFPSLNVPAQVAAPFFTNLLVYAPTFLLIFGFIVDLIKQSFGNSWSSIIGIFAILANKLLDLILVKYLPVDPNPPVVNRAANNVFNQYGRHVVEMLDICDIPGLSFLTTTVMPQPIVLTSAIFWYYLNGAWKYNPGSSIGTSIFAVITLLSQSWFIKQKCELKYGWLSILGALGFGALFGIVGYWSVWGATMQGNDTGIIPSSLPNSLGSSKSSAPGVGTCSAPNDQDQFVCEAYKNGELITSTIAE